MCDAPRAGLRRTGLAAPARWPYVPLSGPDSRPLASLQVGAGVPASELAATPLPTGDLLSRPEAAVLLMVPGVRSSPQLAAAAPNLAALVKSGWSSPLEVPLGVGAAAAAARLVHPATSSAGRAGSVLGSLPEQLPAASVVAASASPVLSRALLGGRAAATVRLGQDAAARGAAVEAAWAKGAAIQVLALAESSAPETLRSELAAFGALPALLRSDDADDAGRSSPVLALLGVSALSAAPAAGGEYAETLAALDAALPTLLAQFDAAYGGRVVVEIVLVSGGVDEGDATMDVAQARRLADADPTPTGFEVSQRGGPFLRTRERARRCACILTAPIPAPTAR